MKQKVPTSPFATRLSGSAKETELRLRNIFQWKKKRPPVVLLILAALIALLCGGLVSCQPEQELSDEKRAEQENVTVDSALDNGMIPKHTAESPELMAKFGQDELFPSKIQVLFLPWETKVWKTMERLSQEQKDLLADLPVDELPRQAAELGSLFRENIWRDTLIPLAADEENDVTLYGVVSAASVPNIGSRVSVSSQALFVDGIVLRHGDRAVYEPLSWEANAWYGTNPWVSVRDFDGDGNTEAAVCLYAGHGTGVSVKNLYFFDLDTLIYTVPDYSAFGEIEVEHDPTATPLL